MVTRWARAGPESSRPWRTRWRGVTRAVVVSIGSIIFGGLGSLSPIISIVILVVSAALILVDFNYIRKHATEDDVIWLATGIFVSIINIFISLLSLSRN